MSPTGHQNQNGPSTPSQYQEQNPSVHYDHNQPNQHPQFGMTPQSNAPKNMYSGVGNFNDGMVARASREFGRDRSHTQHSSDAEPEPPEDDDEFTDVSDEDTDVELTPPKPKAKPKPKRKPALAAVKAPIPKAHTSSKAKKPKKDPEQERIRLGLQNGRKIDAASGINDKEVNRKWDEEEHEYTPEEIAELERQNKELDDPDKDKRFDQHGNLVNKNGRVKGRKLILWHCDRMMEKLILHMQYELYRRGYEIPWAKIISRLSPGSSPQTVVQHLNKLRDALIAEGHLVPPILGKIGQPKDGHLRGYIRDFNSDNITDVREVEWSEDLEERKTSIIDPRIIRGSGNYRKHPEGKGLDKAVRESVAKSGGRRCRQPNPEQPQSSQKRARKQEVEEDLEEVILEDLTPAKRQKSTRATQPHPAVQSQSMMATLRVRAPGALGKFPAGESGSPNDFRYDEDPSPEIKRRFSSGESGSEYVDETPSKKPVQARRTGVTSAPHQASRDLGLDSKASSVNRLLNFSNAHAVDQTPVKPRDNKSREIRKQEFAEIRNNGYAHYNAAVNVAQGSMGAAPNSYGTQYQNAQVHAPYGGNIPHGYPSGNLGFGMDLFQNGYGDMTSNHGLPNMSNTPSINMQGYASAHSRYGRPADNYVPNAGIRNVSGGNTTVVQAPRVYVRPREPSMSEYQGYPSFNQVPARLPGQGPSLTQAQQYRARNNSQGQVLEQHQPQAGTNRSFQSTNPMGFDVPVASTEQTTYDSQNSQENGNGTQSAAQPLYENDDGSVTPYQTSPQKNSNEPQEALPSHSSQESHHSHHSQNAQHSQAFQPPENSQDSQYGNVNTGQPTFQHQYEPMPMASDRYNETQQDFDQGVNDEGQAGEFLNDAAQYSSDISNEIDQSTSYHNDMGGNVSFHG